jgi:hypothetical protein
VTRALAALALIAAFVALAAGCGGSSAAPTPSEDPGQVMKAVVKDELSGQRALSYELLVREQRKVVTAGLYKSCSPGASVRVSGVDVGIVGVRDVVFAVPGLGKTKTKAVSYRIDFHNGTQPITDTGHLIAQEGHWRWTLSAASFDSFSKGTCP